jgi:hypothetical protein
MTMSPMDDDEPPTLGSVGGYPILDLASIPRERWFAVLLPLTVEARRQSLQAAGLHPVHDDVLDLWYELEMRDARRKRAQREALSSGQTPVPRPRQRQVSIRLTADEHADLTAAAEDVGLKPGTLVRMLVVSGIGRMTYARRRHGEAPGPLPERS